MGLGDTPFSMIFSLENGLCPERESSKRYLSDVKSIFYDTAEVEKRLVVDDQLIYEFYELPIVVMPVNPNRWIRAFVYIQYPQLMRLSR